MKIENKYKLEWFVKYALTYSACSVIVHESHKYDIFILRCCQRLASQPVQIRMAFEVSVMLYNTEL